MSPRSGSRPRSCRRSSGSSARSTARAPRCCWSSRTRGRRWPWPGVVTCSRTAASCSRGPGAISSTTSTCSARTSACEGSLIMDELTSASLSDLAQAVRARKVGPVELTRAYLDRIARLDPTLHAYITVDTEVALAAAVVLEREATAGAWRGPLHGVPLAHKDLCLIPGLPTSCGTRTADYFVGAPPCTAVVRLQAAGSLTLGKLNMTELALG